MKVNKRSFCNYRKMDSTGKPCVIREREELENRSNQAALISLSKVPNYHPLEVKKPDLRPLIGCVLIHSCKVFHPQADFKASHFLQLVALPVSNAPRLLAGGRNTCGLDGRRN